MRICKNSIIYADSGKSLAWKKTKLLKKIIKDEQNEGIIA
jgi:hypothetical protein